MEPNGFAFSWRLSSTGRPLKNRWAPLGNLVKADDGNKQERGGPGGLTRSTGGALHPDAYSLYPGSHAPLYAENAVSARHPRGPQRRRAAPEPAAAGRGRQRRRAAQCQRGTLGARSGGAQRSSRPLPAAAGAWKNTTRSRRCKSASVPIKLIPHVGPHRPLLPL